MPAGLRKILFWLHLAAGCIAGVVILVMSVTGVLLAYQKQVIAWVDRDLRVASHPAQAARLSVDAMLASISAANQATPTAITVKADPAAAAEFSFGRERVVWVDPYTGRILGVASPGIRDFFRKVENWHRWLAASDEHRASARAVTGACNFAFLILVVSGPFLWLPRIWSSQAVRSVLLFRRRLHGRARDFNWHHVIGIWCAPALVVIVFAGVVMSYPWANNLLYRVTGNPLPVANAPRAESEARPGRRADGKPAAGQLDLLWARAGQQVPGWQSITARLAPRGDAPVVFTIDTGSGGRPDRRSQLSLDRRTARVVKWEPFSSYNSGRRARSWLRFLHTGEAGGIAGQTIAAIASAGAAVLVYTGLLLAFRRLLAWNRRRRPAESGATVPDRYAVKT